MEKLYITLPEDLVAELRATVPHGKLSAFIAEVAEFYLAWRRQKAALKMGFGDWKDEDHPGRLASVYSQQRYHLWRQLPLPGTRARRKVGNF